LIFSDTQATRASARASSATCDALQLGLGVKITVYGEADRPLFAVYGLFPGIDKYRYLVMPAAF
jgi:hypothetical protein